METLTVIEKPQTRRGRPCGLSPSEYRHELLLSKVNTTRKMNIRAICADLHISRMHFYDILNGRVNPIEAKVVAISERLGFKPGDIIPSKK